MITISQSPTADTRTYDYTQVTERQLYLSSQMHILDVQRALAFFGHLLDDAARRHDFDKLSDVAGFHADFLTGFKTTSWWDRHRKLNRHHLNVADGVPDDVNLIDVLDMIADGVMAGAARSGVEKVYMPQLPDDVLRRAFENTFRLLLAQVHVRVEPQRCGDTCEHCEARSEEVVLRAGWDVPLCDECVAALNRTKEPKP